MDMSQWTLLTYPGISAVVVALVGGVKTLWPKWVDGKEPTVAFALSIIIGVLAKLTMPGAFQTVSWLPHVVFLIGSSFGAKLIHDHIINDVINPSPSTPAVEEKKS